MQHTSAFLGEWEDCLTLGPTALGAGSVYDPRASPDQHCVPLQGCTLYYNRFLFSALEAPVLTLQTHSCGVNSLHVQEEADGHFLVASGSDDGSVALCVIDVDVKSTTDQGAISGAGVQVLKKFSPVCAHAAHVIGVQMLQLDSLLSVSVDQRLTLWRLCEDGLSFVDSKFCHVADVAALECWKAGEQSYHSVICGQGLQVLRVQSEQRSSRDLPNAEIKTCL